jgi:signal transduction histidine kinase
MDTRASDRIADEQAALRRVAVLVAGGASPEEVFAAVTAEVRRLLGADLTALLRYESDQEMTFVARWTAAGEDRNGETRVPLGGRNVSTLVFETGQPARLDDTSGFSGPSGEIVRGLGVRSVVGVPVMVEGCLWGVMLTSNRSEEPFPADATERLAGFTELVGTAIANAQARVELRGYAEEQAALRRVATLVAGGAAPEKVFAAVAAEAGCLLSADLTTVTRYEPQGELTTLGAWSSTGTVVPFTEGTTSLGGRNISGMVFRTGQPARIDDYGQATGAAADVGREWGFRAAVGAPIRVEGRLWGVMAVASSGEEPLPADAEARLAGFTELAGTAIANAEAQAALAASRARVVAAADEARRRIERDLHDGAQQRLVALALQLREAQAAAPREAGDLVTRLDGVAAGLESALAELREIARGIHPAMLSEGGLRPALAALARSSAVPVQLRVDVPGRLPAPVEIAAYYVTCEALANVAKHAGATAATVEAVAGGGVLRVCVRDDGHGGAAFGHGSGLVGLRDRVEALGGRMTLHSPPGAGTTLEVRIPLTD